MESLFTHLYNIEWVRKETRTRLGIQHNTHNIGGVDSLTSDLSQRGLTEIYPKHPVLSPLLSGEEPNEG